MTLFILDWADTTWFEDRICMLKLLFIQIICDVPRKKVLFKTLTSKFRYILYLNFDVDVSKRTKIFSLWVIAIYYSKRLLLLFEKKHSFIQTCCKPQRWCVKEPILQSLGEALHLPYSTTFWYAMIHREIAYIQDVDVKVQVRNVPELWAFFLWIFHKKQLFFMYIPPIIRFNF